MSAETVVLDGFIHAAQQPFAVVAVAGRDIRGRRFSREALERSLPLWAGDPVILGNHTEADFGLVADHRAGAASPVVGQVERAKVVGDELRLYPKFNERLPAALAQKGMSSLDTLRGVSLEAIVDGPAEDSGFKFTNGFVMLTESEGACSISDGCRLVACDGNNCQCGGRDMPETEMVAAEAAAPITLDQVESLVAAAVESAVKADVVTAAADEKEEEAVPKGDTVTISRADFEELRSMAGAFRERESKQRDELIDRLMRLSVYKDASRVELEGKDVATLTEILRVAMEAGAKPETSEDRDHILTAHRKAIAPIHGLDTHVATVEPVKPPEDDLIRERIAKRWG